MIDFHSHILPAVDDGSQDIDTSLKMLKICKDSGIDAVLLTPHCHPRSQEHINVFLENRAVAFALLSSAVKREKEELPKLVPASEIRIYDGMHKYKNLDKLCIQGTDYLLLEMPYEVWRDYAFEEIYQLTRLGFKPLMAHLDRFLDQEHHFGEIFSLGAQVQINSSAIIESSERRKMLKFFESGHFQVLGSDAHNLVSRSPNVSSAYEIIEKKFGKEYIDYINYAGNAILKGEEVLPSRFPKMSFIKRIMF